MPEWPGGRLLAGVVLGQAAVNLVHGLPHPAIPVPMAAWQNAVVVLVVLALPLAGLWLVWRGRVASGGAAILGGGASFARFGTEDHFRSETPNNVANVTGAWSPYFLLTSVGTPLLAVATVVVGGWLLLAGPEAEG